MAAAGSSAVQAGVRKKAGPGLANTGTQKPKRGSATCLPGVGQAGQDALGELQDVAADDRVGALGVARLEGGQDWPVAFGQLPQRQLAGGAQAAEQRPALGIEAVPELE